MLIIRVNLTAFWHSLVPAKATEKITMCFIMLYNAHWKKNIFRNVTEIIWHI